MIISDCNPSSQKVNAVADLSADISELLPYLNSVLKGLHYFEEEKVLMFSNFYRERIAKNVENRPAWPLH
jgi:hypothetical protein